MEPRQRADKWLFQARFFRTRALAAALVAGRHLRINGAKTGKPAHPVGPGDVLTFPQGRRIRVVEVLALAERRGPAAEAQALYRDIGLPQAPSADRPPAGTAPG